jgi:CBS domain containing-hemolysin-like protein
MILTALSTIIVVGLLIGLNALYVAGEFAAVSARKTRIIRLADEGNRLAKIVLPVLQDPRKLDNYIAASQVGITISSITLGIYGQQAIAPRIQPLLASLPLDRFTSAGSQIAAGGIAAILVLTTLTTLQVIVGELVPKTVAIQYPERLALITALPMKWSADYLLKPLIILLNGSGALLLRLLGATYEGGHAHIHSPEEIVILVRESQRGGLLDIEERQLLSNLFRASTKRAVDVAIPRNRVIAAAANEPVLKVLERTADSAYTRIPVFEKDIDHIIGFVHLIDLFNLYQSNREADLRTILRPVPFLPETLPIGEVWNRLNEAQCYLAIVFDEYGGTRGLITREDLIEELFGELQDEFDHEHALISATGDGQYVVRGDMPITDLNGVLDLKLPHNLAKTIGGLVGEELGRVPKVGDIVEVTNVRLRVEAVDNVSISLVRLTLSTSATAESAWEEG